MVYKVSIVIPGSESGGAIINLREIPKVGDRIQVGEMEVEVVEVMDLVPPRGDFHFMHATCKVVEPQK
jgi:hypothetical protein